MLFPPDFNLIDLEVARRHHVMLATLAVAVPVMELHMNLAQFYQERATALMRATGRPVHSGDCRLKLIDSGEIAIAVPPVTFNPDEEGPEFGA